VDWIRPIPSYTLVTRFSDLVQVPSVARCGFSNDGYNYTASVIEQEYQVIRGQSKLLYSTTAVTSDLYERRVYENPHLATDGTWTKSENRVTSVYDGMGRIQSTYGEGTGVSFDGFQLLGQYQQADVRHPVPAPERAFENLNTETKSFTSNEHREGRYEEPLTNPDGSWSRQTNAVVNEYEDVPATVDGRDVVVRKLKNVTGTGAFESDDGFGNHSRAPRSHVSRGHHRPDRTSQGGRHHNQRHQPKSGRQPVVPKSPI